MAAKKTSPAKRRSKGAEVVHSKVDKSTVLAASKALLKHARKQAKEKAEKTGKLSLLDDDNIGGDTLVLLSFALKRTPDRNRTFKGWPVRMPKPICGAGASVCLFVKDKKEAEARLAKNPVPQINSHLPCSPPYRLQAVFGKAGVSSAPRLLSR